MEEKLEQLTLVQSALIGIGLAAFYYFFVYSVTNSDALVQRTEEEIVQTNGQIKSVDTLIREKQELEAELLKNTELVKSSADAISLEFDSSDAMGKLTDKARSFGLSIESIGAFNNWTKSKDEQFSFAELNLSLRGTFGQVMFFLSDFTREAGFYTVRNLKLSPENSAPDGKSNILNSTMTITILKRTDQISVAGAAGGGS